MSTRIDYSATESETLGIKIGRCNTDYFDEKELYRLITEGAYDLCRVKVCAEDEFAQFRLAQTGLPAFFSGSIRKYKTKITEKPAGGYIYPDLIWEEYDGSQEALLRDMLVGTWGKYPLGYYRTPFLNLIVDKKKEIESVFRFYKKQNNPNVNPDNTLIFIRHRGNYVGFFALNKVKGNLECHIAGILEPYRSRVYFFDWIRFAKEYCITHQLKYFIFGARNENSGVQRIFQYAGCEAIGSENVFHIPSLLSFGSETATKIEVKAKSKGEFYSKLLAEVTNMAEAKSCDFSRTSFHLNQLDFVDFSMPVTVTVTVPIQAQSELLIVVKSGPLSGGYITGYYRVFG